MPLKLIVGLGNPGPDYSETRHNAGFWFLDRLAAERGTGFTADKKFHGEIARVLTDHIDCRLLKPSTFMNRSGRAAQAAAAYYHVAPDEMLIVHDEIDLDAGIARLKQGGGHGGHNGLRDIIEQTGGNGFLRLRIGVGHPGSSKEVHDYVLHRPDSGQRKLIDAAIEDALAVMPLVFGGQANKAMTLLHTTKKDAGGQEQK